MQPHPIAEESEEEEEELDEDELNGFAEHLGMDPLREQHLMWICRLALQAPVPEGWTAHEDGDGNTYASVSLACSLSSYPCRFRCPFNLALSTFVGRYFFHEERGQSSWEHPSDSYFRKLYHRCVQMERERNATSGQISASAKQANLELNSQLDKLKRKHDELKIAADKVRAENDELTQRAVGLAVELDDTRQHHAAEMAALTSNFGELRGKASALPRLEEENTQLRSKVESQQQELERYTKGEVSSVVCLRACFATPLLTLRLAGGEPASSSR